MDPRYCGSLLEHCGYTLWSLSSQLRYYPLALLDFGPLLTALDLEGAGPGRLSTRKFFRDFTP